MWHISELVGYYGRMVYGSYDQVAIQPAMWHISELVGYYGRMVYVSYNHVPIQAEKCNIGEYSENDDVSTTSLENVHWYPVACLATRAVAVFPSCSSFRQSNARIFAKLAPVFFLQKWVCLKNLEHCSGWMDGWMRTLVCGFDNNGIMIIAT